jgi:hypothetical protein
MAGCGSGCVIAHLASDSACSPQVKLTMEAPRLSSLRDAHRANLATDRARHGFPKSRPMT